MVTIITRAQWGARPPKRAISYTSWSRRIGVAFHYSQGNPAATPRDLQAYAQDTLNYADTHYNFFVDRQGRAYEGRGWLAVAAHAEDQNTPWIGICFIGRDSDVTDAALATMHDLWREAQRLKGGSLRYSGHGQLPGQNTSCPGERIKLWIARGIPRPNVNTEDDDMKASYGERNETVRDLQKDLLFLDPTVLPEFGADGGYGDETAVAVSRVLTGGEGKVVDALWFRRLDTMVSDKKLALALAALPAPTLPESVVINVPAQSITAQLSPS